MKKVFLLSLGLILGLSAFAQNRSAKMAKTNDTPKEAVISQVQQIMAGREAAPATVAPMAKPNMTRVANSRYFKDGEVEFEEFETMVTNYDLQSNSALGNRMAAWPDGSAVVTETRGMGESYEGRGTGYNYYDGEDFGEQPEESVECAANNDPTYYAGWPSICAVGNSEYLASHSGGNVEIYKRDVKGTGDWTKISTISGRTWPRLGYTTDGTLHIICADQTGNSSIGYTNYINYYRSTDGGLTWTENPYIATLEDEHYNNIGADDYVMATNGERVAIMFGGYTYDVFYILSEDAGLTWTKQTIAAVPYPELDLATNWNGGNPIISSNTDTIYAADNSLAIAIGNDGTVHCAFGLFAWAPSTNASDQFSYWRGYQSIVYWNSQYTNEQGGHNIPAFGDWSGDANHPGWNNNGENGISGTLRYKRLWEMTWANEQLENGDPNLNIFGWNSEKTPGSPCDLEEYWDNSWGSYRTYGAATMPAICLDDNNNVTVVFAQLSDDRTAATTDGPYYLYSIWMHQRINNVWNDPCTEVSLSTDVTHMMDECYSVSGITNAANNTMWFSYSADDEFDLFLDLSNGGVQEEQTDNTIYVIKLATYDVVADTKDVVYNIYPNPASDYIRISSEANANATITFVNLAGQTVKTFKKSLVAGDNTISIDLASGVYFCTVNANGFSKTTKVVVK